MFTGIVQALGRVRSFEGGVLVVDPPASWAETEPLGLGESVAVDGCCLTVVSSTDGAVFELSPETIHRTAFGGLSAGSPVNLERAMRASDRFGGHIVQGHVDATGSVLEIEPQGDHWRFRFQAPRTDDRFLIDKGSISVDGISLTIVEPRDGAFDVWIIPHTFHNTNLHAKKPGSPVNLEFDVLAKHVEKLLASSRV